MKKVNGERGQTLIFVALGMTMLLGFAGFATDVGVLLHVKREAQTAADAAALAAATETLAEGNPTTITEGVWNAAATDATSNGFSAAAVTSDPGGTSSCHTTNGTTLCINLASNVTVPTFNLPGYVQATISETAPTIFIKAFMGLFGNASYSGMTVGATAIASDTIKSQGCFYVTDLTGDSPSFDITTGNNTVITPKCAVYVNGNLSIGGSSSINAGSGSVVATGSISGGSGITGAQASGVPPQPIPLAGLLTAAPTISNGTCTPPANSGFLANQCYLNAPLTGPLAAGLYVFTQTPVFGANVTGSDVTIYLDGSFPYDDGNSSIQITGPPAGSGIFSQVVFDAPTDSPGAGFGCPKGNSKNNVAGVLHMNFGSSTTAYSGIVYAPYAHLFVQDQGSSNGSINTDLIIGTVCGQSATFEVSGLSGGSPITQVGLVY